MRGEISSGRARGSFYCELVETDAAGKTIAKVSTVIFQSSLDRIRAKFQAADMELQLTDGTEIGLLCRLNYSPLYGISLVGLDADPVFSLGLLELRKKQILARLTKEGLLEPNKRHKVPALPCRIGLITARSSAAYADFVRTLQASGFGFEILLADAFMQGPGTEGSVLAAFDALEKLNPDVVCLVRGGGSRVDLSHLDNEAVARRIASLRVAVWTGIGHETDTSVLDHVAHRSFKTPTAVGEEIVQRFEEMQAHLLYASNTLQSVWGHRLRLETRWLSEQVTGIREGSRKLLDQCRTDILYRANRLSTRVRERLEKENLRVHSARHDLRARCAGRIDRGKLFLASAADSLVRGAERTVRAQRTLQQGFRARFVQERFLGLVERDRRMLVLASERVRGRAEAALEERRRHLMQLGNRFSLDRALARISAERRTLAAKESAVRSADPRTALARGFAIVTQEDGSIVKSIDELAVGRDVRTELSDGALTGTITQIERKLADG